MDDLNKVITMAALLRAGGQIEREVSASFLMTGLYFGHFRHQGVKISICHKPIFYSKFTKEHNGSTQKSIFFNFVSAQIWQGTAYIGEKEILRMKI